MMIFQNCIYIAKRKKIKFLSSPFDLESIKFLKDKIKMDYYKIPSGEITNYPYLKYLGKLNKKILLSTGMAELSEINFAIKTLIKNGTKRNNITVLHCISDYPTKIENVNLNFINTLKKISKNVGFSDHTLGTQSAVLAIALKVNIIEKHFTLNKKMKGPDHSMSLNVNEFKNFVKNIKDTEVILGKDKKILTKGEKILKKFARKSLIAKTNIKKNEKFSELNLTTKRPGDGKSPILWKSIIGKKQKKIIKKMKKFNILFFSSGRSDYDLIKPIINEFKKFNYLNSYLILTGSHLSKQHGQTFKNIDQKLVKKLFKINIKSDYIDYENFNLSFILAQKKFEKVF